MPRSTNRKLPRIKLLRARASGVQVIKARNLYLSRKLVRAERILRTILSKCPCDYDALVLLGDICADFGRTDAVLYYKRAIATRPDDPTAYLMCANALLDKGRARKAEQFSRKALWFSGRLEKLNRLTSELAFDTLVNALITQNKYREAMKAAVAAKRQTGINYLVKLCGFARSSRQKINGRKGGVTHYTQKKAKKD